MKWTSIMVDELCANCSFFHPCPCGECSYGTCGNTKSSWLHDYVYEKMGGCNAYSQKTEIGANRFEAREVGRIDSMNYDEPKQMEFCASCRCFVPDVGEWSDCGLCHRFPDTVTKNKGDYCGEYAWKGNAK